MRRLLDPSRNAPSTQPAVPDGWYPIHATPAAKASSTSRHHDALGLARGVHAAHIRVPKLQSTTSSSTHETTTDTTAVRVRDSPRHRRLQQTQHRPTYGAADAFAPNRSLRLASLKPQHDEALGSSVPSDAAATSAVQQQREEVRGDATATVGPARAHVKGAGLSARSRAARFRETTRDPPIVPLHDVVRGFDDAVGASPLAESNQVAVTELFVANWMDRFERERGLYKSIVLHAEIAFRELYRLTANIASPNDVVTAFACKILDDMADHFGPYAMIVRVLHSELRQSIYAPPVSPPPVSPPLPYYAIVKHQKRILVSLRKDQIRRQERNDFLRYEIDKVHETFLHFLDQCSLGLVRTIFREWYSVAIVSKRNSKKYIEYFSAWFGSSAKAMVPRLFLAWRGLAVETKVARLHEQLTSDQAKLAAVQKQIEELTVQRNLAQLESLAIRNDRKHAEDTIQRLHRKIQSASAFLEDTHRREAFVAQEGQLRVEAVTFLPPLVLESLLRGFHNVGFLQPLHGEFTPASPTKVASSTQPSVAAMEGSALRQCVAALQVHAAHVTRSPGDQASGGGAGHDVPLHECLNYVNGIRLRVEDDSTAHLLFLPKAELTRSREQQAARQSHERDADDATEEDADDAPSQHDTPLGLQELVHQFNMALRNVRHQDEHYARHAKLFSSRMLEQSEISVVPHALVPSLGEAPPSPLQLVSTSMPHQRVLFSSIDNARVAGSTCLRRGSDGGHEGSHGTAACRSLDQLPLFEARDLELSSQHTRVFIILTLGQLLIEYGSLLFSPTDLTAFVKNRLLHKIMFRGIAGGKHTLKKIHVPVVATADDASDGDSDGSSSDDEENEQGETVSNLASCSPTEATVQAKKGKGGGMAMLHKQTTQRRMQVAPRRVSSYRGFHAPLAKEIDRGLSQLKTAYDVWNRISQQLIQADIVAARGAIVSAEGAGSVAVDPRASMAGGTSGVPAVGGGVSPLVLPEKSPTPFGSMRPRLQLHIEPLPGGPLMASAKERDRNDAVSTPSSGHRRSVAALTLSNEWSYETSKLRQLSLGDTQQLLHAVRGLHDVVRSSAQQRAADFTAAKQQLRDVRAMQWHYGCELASQFACFDHGATPTTLAPVPENVGGHTLLDDDRRHVFECIRFENDAIERLFSVEDHPEDELLRVQTLLERKKHVVRHALYCRHRAGATHATTLDDLWHVVKVLQLPRDVRVLPTLRDEELVGTSYFNEQFFSPDDVAEVLLQLCNEQFLPQITPLSARVEHLVTHHLPLAMQNQSAIREIMHKPDVKKALSDHGQTLRTIFRRYCAKEKDLLAAAAAKRRAAVVAATTAVAGSPVTTAAHTSINAAMYTAAAAAASTVTPTAPPVVSAAPQGITKFMRLADWHAFVADYKLLRARFTAEYATVVFCNVQEAESGLEDNLEMIYSEFTEAIVALAVCFFPDPFLRHATRVHQFIRRYLPVSPDEVRDHHA